MKRVTFIFWAFILSTTLLVEAKDNQQSDFNEAAFFYEKQTSNMNLIRRVRDTSSPTNTSTPEVLNTDTSGFKDSGSSDDPANKTDSTVAAKPKTHTEIIPETTKDSAVEEPVSSTTTTSRTDVQRDDKLFYSKYISRADADDKCDGDDCGWGTTPSPPPGSEPDPTTPRPPPVTTPNSGWPDCCDDDPDCFPIPDPWLPNPDPMLPNPDPMLPNPDPMLPNPDPMLPNPDPMLPNPDPMMPNPDPMMPCPNPSGPCNSSPSSRRTGSSRGGSIATKVIGGRETTIEKHPYQVSLQYKHRPFCGGSILNHDTVLTAAHCFDQIKRDMYPHLAIKVGATVYSNGQQYQIARIVRNKNYNRGATSNNDVAIMKLAKPLTFSSRVKPIELQPAGKPVLPGTTAVVTGWGTVVPGARVIPGALREAPLGVISNSQCQGMYSSANYWITTAMLCTSAPGRDSCQGDSGGPLVADGKLIGVVSWGIGCAEARYPGVYANVSTLHDFISKFM